MTHYVGLALEWWRASGERTLERLDSLCDFVGTSYGLPPEVLADVKVRARSMVRAWEVQAS